MPSHEVMQQTGNQAARIGRGIVGQHQPVPILTTARESIE